MVSIVLVHGLAASKQHWQPLIPHFAGVNIINYEIPGHGESKSLQFDWKNTVLTLQSLLSKSEPTIYILHSFAASFLPEIIKAVKKTDRIILLEGIIHINDAKWTKSSVFQDKLLFANWVKKFRIGGKVILKYQLIGSHNKSDIDLWSSGFSEVNEDAINIYARKFVERLKSKEILNTFKTHASQIIYIRGEKSNLSKSSISTIKQSNVPLHAITNSGHFPMLDNPIALHKVIKNIINEIS